MCQTVIYSDIIVQEAYEVLCHSLCFSNPKQMHFPGIITSVFPNIVALKFFQNFNVKILEFKIVSLEIVIQICVRCV